MQDHDLWSRLQAMRLDDPKGDLPFSVKLARDQGWTEDHTKAVIAEYKRYVYLAVISQDEATPSPDIDQAWHLHLTYTKHYWSEMCDKILKQPLHHVPCASEAEMPRYRAQFEATKALYLREFQSDPPSDVWPAANAESLAHTGHWVFNTGMFATIASLFLLVPSGDRIWWMALAVSLAVWAFGWFLERRHKPKGRQSSGDGGGGACGDGDGCGGCGGGGD